jgi:hypothetical protein
MSKSTEFRKLVTQGLPIALIILYLLFPVVFVRASEHPLGKFVAVMIIVLYTYQDMIQGLIICLLIIIFYHKEVEGFISETTQNYVDFLPKPSRKTNNEFENHLEKDFTPIEDFCDASLNNVKYKDQKVKNCLVTHVYPELQFRDGECNPCDKTCHFSVQHKQRVEQHLQPTSSKRGIVWDMLDSMVGSTDEPIVLNKQIATKIIE